MPEPERPEAASPASEVSLLDILLVLEARWRFLLRAVCICTVVATLLAFVLPVTYTATTTILPPQQSSSLSSSLLTQLGSLGSLVGAGAIKNPSDLYVGLLKSATVEVAMVDHYDLRKEYGERDLSVARKKLEDHVTIDGSGKDGLIKISVRARTPQRAAELANGYVQQYRQLSESLAVGEASQRRLFLENQLKQTKDALASAEEALKHSQQSSGMIQLDSQARALIESAGTLRAQIAAKEVLVQSMRTYAGPGNTELIEAEQELAGLKAQLTKLSGAGNGSDDLILSKGQISQAGTDYIRKVRDVKYQETIFEILARQYEVARIDEAREGSPIQVVDVAFPPDRKSWPPRLLFILGGAVLGLLGASTWVLIVSALLHLSEVPEYSARVTSSKLLGSFLAGSGKVQ